MSGYCPQRTILSCTSWRAEMTASAPTTAPPDIYEETATSLEKAQAGRYKAFINAGRPSEDFWTNATENKIFEEIKAARTKSTTYHPDNER